MLTNRFFYKVHHAWRLEYITIVSSSPAKTGETCVTITLKTVSQGETMNRYLLITNRTESFNSADIPGHYEHLEQLKQNNRLELYGPFSDVSGGAYLIKAESLEEAIAIGNADPLIKSGSSTLSVKEWLTK
jgi:uncharacterized protein YciI